MVFLLYCAPALWGQRHYRHAAFLNAGYNFRGYFFGMGYRLNLSYPRDDQWKLSLEGQASYEWFEVEGERVPVNLYMGMLSINHAVNELFRETIFHSWKAYIGLGGLYGNERINEKRPRFKNHVWILDRSKNVYGLFANISAFIPLFSMREDLYLRLNYKPMHIFNSDLGNFIHNIGLGIVYSL